MKSKNECIKKASISSAVYKIGCVQLGEEKLKAFYVV